MHQSTSLRQPLNLSLNSGNLLLLQGHNGCGKTTCLKTLAGLYPPAEGAIYFKGEKIQQVHLEYREHLLFIGHETGLWPDLTAIENLEFFRALSPQSDRTIDEALAFFELMPFRHQPIRQLSAGQKRKVALCRLLLQSAPIWMLDEPFNTLDPPTIQKLTQYLCTHLTQGGIVLMVSHQPFQSDRILGIHPKTLALSLALGRKK